MRRWRESVQDAQVVAMSHQIGVSIQKPIEPRLRFLEIDLSGHDEIGGVMVALGLH